MAMSTLPPLDIIGMHESLSLPTHRILNLKAKTDTGAYNSAIDCCYSEEREGANGEKILVYVLLNKDNPLYTGEEHTATKFGIKKVRSSNGIVTHRYQVKLDVELNGHSFKTTFNLSNRSKMRYAVLLGRRLLAHRFVVDVAKGRRVKKVKTEPKP
jgi:hypothetical protein